MYGHFLLTKKPRNDAYEKEKLLFTKKKPKQTEKIVTQVVKKKGSLKSKREKKREVNRGRT